MAGAWLRPWLGEENPTGSIRPPLSAATGAEQAGLAPARMRRVKRCEIRSSRSLTDLIEA
jgi:hypothetical protein